MNHDSPLKRSANPQAFFLSSIRQAPDQIKYLLIGWYLLLALLTFFGSARFLADSLHPLYLVITLVFIPLLFFILTLCRLPSLLAPIFMAIIRLLPLKTSPPKIPLPSPKERQLYLAALRFIAHSSWLVIFIALSILLGMKFSLQHYDFYLSSTLFSNNPRLYQTLFSMINWLPNLLGINSLTSDIILNTINNILTDNDRAIWARWILMIILFYGAFPRAIATIITWFTLRRHYRESQPKTTTIIRETIQPTIQKPVVTREENRIKRGSGEYMIAVDFLESDFDTTYSPRFINTLESFNQFKNELKNAPAKQLIIFIDASQTPDRGVIRRITQLMNYALQSDLYCIMMDQSSANQVSQPNRFEQWKERLTPLLQESESLHSSLESLNKRVN